MTLVRITLTVPSPDGVPAPATGTLRFTPTARRVNAGQVVLPAPFPVELIGGAADVTLEPTTAAWVWQVDEYLTGLPPRRFFVSVPDMAETDYPDLPVVNPSTLAPAPAPDPSWVASTNLQLARTPEVLIVGPITRDEDGAPTSADVLWPDGTAGTFTGTPSPTVPGALDGWAITYGARTYTQPLVTRDSAGNITDQPPITIS